MGVWLGVGPLLLRTPYYQHYHHHRQARITIITTIFIIGIISIAIIIKFLRPLPLSS